MSEELTLENDPKYEAWRQAHPEWRTMFPVLEMRMTERGLFISLADEKVCHKVTLPKEMVETLVTKWQEFQNGKAPESRVLVLWRNYTGAWPKDEML